MMNKSNVTPIPHIVTGNSFGDNQHNSIAIPRELCMDATSEKISQSLNHHNGDANIAAHELLDMSQDILGKDCKFHAVNQLFRMSKCCHVLILYSS